MHHITKIAELTDEIAPSDLYLIIGYLTGSITEEQAMSVQRAYRDYFFRQLEIAKRVAIMLAENNDEIEAIWKKHEPMTDPTYTLSSDPNHIPLDPKTRIIVDNGDMFDGSPDQFANTFFSNVSEANIRTWAAKEKYKVQFIKPGDDGYEPPIGHVPSTTV